ncbi:MAG: hypothetical protein PHX45_13270 [Acidobacteriota bacterium]|nr:hypothetical protein [Acidobacteriota bacterium]
MAGFNPTPQILQAGKDISKEGLPYWILWLLLCIILLLVVFIFLRDKDLRHRISSFMSGAKRKMLRMRLQAKLKKEKAKREALIMELGKKAWSEDMSAPSAEETCRRLRSLDEENNLFQKRWHELYSQIETFHGDHEKVRRKYLLLIKEQEDAKKPYDEKLDQIKSAEKSIDKDLQQAHREIASAENSLRASGNEVQSIEGHPKMSDGDKSAALARLREKAGELENQAAVWREKIPGLQEQAARLQTEKEENAARADVHVRKIKELRDELKGQSGLFGKKIKDLEEEKKKAQEKIMELKKIMDPLFESLGRTINEDRVDNKELAIIYFQIDGVDQAIARLHKEIENLLS